MKIAYNIHNIFEFVAENVRMHGIKKNEGQRIYIYTPGPGCSKLMTSLVNETLKFQTLMPQICQYFC